MRKLPTYTSTDSDNAGLSKNHEGHSAKHSSQAVTNGLSMIENLAVTRLKSEKVQFPFGPLRCQP